MPRKNAKSAAFKHAQGRSSDDKRPELPPHPQVPPPKHIPLPDLPCSSDLAFEVDALVFSLLAMAGQYINLFRSVFWLPYSHTEYALNYYLIDYDVMIINLIMLGRRLPVCILKKLCSQYLPATYEASCKLGIYIFTSICLFIALSYFSYNVVLEHGILSLVFLTYPFMVFGFVLGASPTLLLEAVPSPPVHHTCSSSAPAVREEVERLRRDFNERWKLILFNTFLVVYHAAFLPCHFSPGALHYDVRFATQHAIFTGVGCVTLYVAHCFPPKYCDVMHRAALHLGRWYKVKAAHGPTCPWGESSLWKQGVLVKYNKELFKAEGISNAAQPGHAAQSRFYSLFKDPSSASQLLWLLQLVLLSAEMLVLLRSHAWNDLISVQLLVLVNCKTLYGMTRSHFVAKRIYREEGLLTARFSS